MICDDSGKKSAHVLFGINCSDRKYADNDNVDAAAFDSVNGALGVKLAIGADLVDKHCHFVLNRHINKNCGDGNVN